MSTLENQSWTKDENTPPNLTEGQGTGTKYGIHAFDSLTTEVQNVALSAYVNALNRGWQVSEAEVMAREALERIRLQNEPMPTAPETEEQPITVEDLTDEPETTYSMTKIAKIIFWLAGACAVGYFALQALLGPATPLQAAITARSKAAVTLADATAKENAANSALSIAKARYEAAYKREVCFISGSVNCK